MSSMHLISQMNAIPHGFPNMWRRTALTAWLVVPSVGLLACGVVCAIDELYHDTGITNFALVVCALFACVSTCETWFVLRSNGALRRQLTLQTQTQAKIEGENLQSKKDSEQRSFFSFRVRSHKAIRDTIFNFFFYFIFRGFSPISADESWARDFQKVQTPHQGSEEEAAE
jgi:hypothetical protein